MSQNQPSSSRAAGSKPWLLWAVGAAVVIVLLIVAVVATGGDDKDAKGSQDSASESTPDAGDASLPRFESTNGDPAIGMTIPTVSGMALDGKPMTIGAADGKAKVIVFVAHWCPHCQAEVPRIVERLKSKPMPAAVELLTVSTGASPDAPNYPPKAWLDREGWTAPVLDDVDSSAGRAYGLSSYPFFVVADSSGKVVVRGKGELTMDQFDQLVAAAESGKL